ncbi:MAG: hypothetical protein Q8R79_07610 [Legionellaceae bacterium]|nr:hypothetical protein [Legionellaceae bacterium]
MRRIGLGVACILVLLGCTPRDQHYYFQHPHALQKEALRCQAQSEHCQNLQQWYAQMQQLASELSQDPQAFGQSIIQLQTQLAMHEDAVSLDPSLQSVIDTEKQDIFMRLSVVKWLESPES